LSTHAAGTTIRNNINITYPGEGFAGPDLQTAFVAFLCGDIWRARWDAPGLRLDASLPGERK
jgi:hypothetical protein